MFNKSAFVSKKEFCFIKMHGTMIKITIPCFEESVQFKVRSLLLKYRNLTTQITIFLTTFR